MKKTILVLLYLLAMVALGAGSQYALLAGTSRLAHASHTAAKSGTAAYGRLRELGQFRDYSTIKDVEGYTVSDTGTTEWFAFTAGDTDIAKLASALQTKESFPVAIVAGRAVLPVYCAPARDGREAWQYYLMLPGGDPAAGETVPPWWKPATLAGSMCYLNRSSYAFAEYVFYDAVSGRGYMVVRWG